MQYSNLYRKRQISDLKILNGGITEYEHKLCLLLDNFFLNKKLFNDASVDVEFFVFYINTPLEESFTYSINDSSVRINTKLFWNYFSEYKDLSLIDIKYLVVSWVESIRPNFKVDEVFINTYQENLRSTKMSEISRISNYWDFLFLNIKNYENNLNILTLQSFIDENKDNNKDDDGTEYNIADINSTIKLIYDFSLEHHNKNVVSYCDVFKTLKYLIVGDIDVFDEKLKKYEHFLTKNCDIIIKEFGEAVKNNKLKYYLKNDINWNLLTTDEIYFCYDMSIKFPLLNDLILKHYL